MSRAGTAEDALRSVQAMEVRDVAVRRQRSHGAPQSTQSPETTSPPLEAALWQRNGYAVPSLKDGAAFTIPSSKEWTGLLTISPDAGRLS